MNDPDTLCPFVLVIENPIFPSVETQHTYSLPTDTMLLKCKTQGDVSTSKHT